MKTEKDKVIYRKFSNGEVIALFPQIMGDDTGYMCSSYVHTGQHSPAAPTIISITKPAKPKDYAELHKELLQIGYNPVIAHKFTYADQKIRAAQYQNLLK